MHFAGTAYDVSDEHVQFLSEHVQDPDGLLDSFKQSYRTEIVALRGVTVFYLQKITATGDLVIVVVAPDWDGAEMLEKLQRTIWQSVVVVRDSFQDLVYGEEFIAQLLVGSRASTGGMTAGAIVRVKDGSKKAIYMFQPIGEPTRSRTEQFLRTHTH
ncbi:hypothetical protein BDD12DRAFT_906241 [Trichophaea hybrida]|nr:hypothetical protein BDD12DRAFT_906241 [Trichophaea hybrida]